MKIIPDVSPGGRINFAVHSESRSDDAIMDLLYEESKRADLEFCLQGNGRARGSGFFCFGHIDVSKRRYVLRIKSNDNYLTMHGYATHQSVALQFRAKEEAAFYLADKKRGALKDFIIELYLPE